MNTEFYIAKRYLFSKKSHNAVNIISSISMCGVIVATIALVCTLSIFNGFTNVTTMTFSAFDPDLQITPITGKVFDPKKIPLAEIKNNPSVDLISETLEENALLRFADRQEPVVLKGVSSQFKEFADTKKILLDGEFVLRDGDIDFGVIGVGLASRMGTRAGFVTPLEVYIPKRNERITATNFTTAFTRTDTYVSGVFALNQISYDDQMFIVSISLVRELLNYTNEVSALDIKIKEGASIDNVQKELTKLLGSEFIIKNRFQQQENLYHMVNVEKWVTFLILTLVSIIAIFNVVGSLSILIMEKKEDTRILQSLGASNRFISNIFMLEGCLITFIGSIAGVILGFILCLLQQHYGLLKLGEAGAFVIDAYPVSVHFPDVLLIFITVNIIGFLAIIYPVLHLRQNLKNGWN